MWYKHDQETHHFLVGRFVFNITKVGNIVWLILKCQKHQLNKDVKTTFGLFKLPHKLLQSGELWDSPSYRTPKVTCSRVHKPEIKKMLLMRWLWVRLSCWRHSPSERMRGIEIVAPNAVRQCCIREEVHSLNVAGIRMHPKMGRVLCNTYLNGQKDTEVPGRSISHKVGEFVSVLWCRADVMWLLLLTFRLSAFFRHLQGQIEQIRRNYSC